MSHGVSVSPTEPGGFAAGSKVGAGRYTLVRMLGQGGMGAVWLARDARLGEDVALKFISRELAHDEVAVGDLRRETLKSRKLTHPNILRIHDLHLAPEESPFLSMEFVDGATVSRLKTQQPQRLFAWDALKPLVAQLCAALDYAHAQKVVHRDLKPANLLVTAAGTLSLADFGIAASAASSLSRLTNRRGTSGTPAYMSPQQARGEPAQVADDLYALGATLYELLTSKPPFYQGDIFRQVLEIGPVPMERRLVELELRNDIPAEVSATVMACLAKDADLRPASAAEVAARLGLGELAPAPFRWEAEGLTTRVSGPDAASGLAGPIRWPSLGWIWGTAAGVLLLSLAWGTLHYRQRSIRTATAVEPNSAGQLDQTFGIGGKVVTDFGGENLAYSVAVQNDDRLVVAGEWHNGSNYDFALARYLADGALDKEFGNGGKVTAAIGPGEDTARSIVLQADGKLIVVGFAHNGQDNDFAVARFNMNGSLDASFGEQGKVITTFGEGEERAYSVVMQPDQQIVVAGYATESGKNNMALVRYRPDGTLDPAFGQGGKVTTSFNSNHDRAAALALQSDGKIVVAGRSRSYFAVARYHVDGKLDERFGTGGRVTTAIGAGPAIAYSIVVQRDGKLVVAGHALVAGKETFAVVRYHSDGSLDPTFNTTGKATTTIGAGDARGFTMALLPDGGILVAGCAANASNQDFALARYRNDGSLDSTFGSNGRTTTDVRPGDDAAWGVTVGADGNVVLVGYAHNGKDRDFAIVRYLDRH